MRKCFVGFLETGLLAILIGCNGFDKNQVLIHPDSVEPTGIFDVTLVNMFTYLDSGSTVSGNIIRDSLHLLVGLPETWSITNATMAVIREPVIATIFNGEDSEIASLLQQYQDKTVALSIDDALSSQINGDTITAHDRTGEGEKIKVVTDRIKIWKGFSAPVDIVLGKGDKPDTLFPFDDAITTASELGLLDNATVTDIRGIQRNPLLSTILPDTIGMRMVPVVMFLKIQAGSNESNDTLFYFSKTGMMNPAPSSAITLAATLSPQMVPQLSALEYGDMTYIPVSVSSVATIQPLHASISSGLLHASADRNGYVHFDLGRYANHTSCISIFSLQGELVKSLFPGGRHRILWDCTNHKGNRLPPGSYTIRFSDRFRTATTTIYLIK